VSYIVEEGRESVNFLSKELLYKMAAVGPLGKWRVRGGGALLPCTARILHPVQPKKLCKKSKNHKIVVYTFH
jgi:hypothetical protein